MNFIKRLFGIADGFDLIDDGSAMFEKAIKKYEQGRDVLAEQRKTFIDKKLAIESDIEQAETGIVRAEKMANKLKEFIEV